MYAAGKIFIDGDRVGLGPANGGLVGGQLQKPPISRGLDIQKRQQIDSRERTDDKDRQVITNCMLIKRDCLRAF
jgi:hypothetical protein